MEVIAEEAEGNEQESIDDENNDESNSVGLSIDGESTSC